MNSLFENGGGKLLILVYTDLRGGNDIGKNRSVPNPFIYIRVVIQICNTHDTALLKYIHTGADPGFLERGFICIKVWVRFGDFISFFLNVP